MWMHPDGPCLPVSALHGWMTVHMCPAGPHTLGPYGVGSFRSGLVPRLVEVYARASMPISALPALSSFCISAFSGGQPLLAATAAGTSTVTSAGGLGPVHLGYTHRVHRLSLPGIPWPWPITPWRPYQPLCCLPSSWQAQPATRSPLVGTTIISPKAINPNPKRDLRRICMQNSLALVYLLHAALGRGLRTRTQPCMCI
jgi:hypothetical protein